jgi:tetratricopeptide (TPR) repeat protein
VLFAATIMLLLLGMVGATFLGWLGEAPHNVMLQFWTLGAGFVAVYYELFDRMGKVLAPFVAIASGGYAIYQKWHYAGRNMHLRLQEFLAREETRLRDADKKLDASAVRPGPARSFKSPIFDEASLATILSEMGWGTLTWRSLFSSRMQRAEQEVERATTELQQQLDLWDQRKRDYQHRLMQAYLVKGALAARRAAKIKAAGGDDREDNQAALTAFERAIDVNPDAPDPLAVEFAAHQRVRLGDYSGGSADFGRLLNLVANASAPSARARALKFQAEILEFGNGPQPNVNSATQLLNSAIDLLPPQRTRSDVEDAAELHEMQGRVRSKRPNCDWDGAALSSYTTAEGLYSKSTRPKQQPLSRALLRNDEKFWPAKRLNPMALRMLGHCQTRDE